jgi:hypothetical protein
MIQAESNTDIFNVANVFISIQYVIKTLFGLGLGLHKILVRLFVGLKKLVCILLQNNGKNSKK